MRWPWVSRAAHDRNRDVAEMCRQKEQYLAHVCDDYAKRYSEMSTRYDALLDKYHALKMQGAAPVPATPTVVPPRAKDAVLEAIATVAGSNAALRGVLGKYARQARADGVSDDRIIEELHDWPEDDEGVPA